MLQFTVLYDLTLLLPGICSSMQSSNHKITPLNEASQNLFITFFISPDHVLAIYNIIRLKCIDKLCSIVIIKATQTKFLVSHPSAYKNSVRGEAIYYLYLEVKGQMRLFLQV